MFSIIVLSYNNEYKKIENTLNSILAQTYKGGYEIIVADDGSENFESSLIEEYFTKHGFGNYQILEHANYGILGNVLDALNHSNYNYVKPIGAGDLLHKNALDRVSEVFENYSCAACTVGLMAFRYDKNGDKNILGLYNRPCLMPDKEVILSEDAENILVYEDYMSGASLFYKTDIARKYMEINSEIVRSCEDLVQVNILLDGYSIGIIKEPLVDYEYGTGVSTDAEVGKAEALKTGESEHERFYQFIRKTYPHNVYVKKLLKRRKIERSNWLYRKTSNLWFPKKLILKKIRRKIIIN